MTLALSDLSLPIVLVGLLLIGFSIASWTLFFWKLTQVGTIARAHRRFWAGQAEVPSPLARLSQAAHQASPNDRARVLRRAASAEIDQLERGVSFLATTASTTPFIGLFGTVWGIMNAFGQIGAAGSTSLAIVAPGISEALLTTALGLAVAIPAVMGFNFLQSRVRRLTIQIDDGVADLLDGE